MFPDYKKDPATLAAQLILAVILYILRIILKGRSLSEAQTMAAAHFDIPLARVQEAWVNR